MGKQVITAKQRHGKDPLFPLAVALSDLHPLTKVWVDFVSHPKSTFTIKVNDSDVYNLTKEEANYDPSKTETLNVRLNVNNKKDSNGRLEWAI